MKSKQFRMLTENGINYMFNANAFADYLYKKKRSEKISLESLYGEIADATGYSTDAVKKWKLGCNGVADVETVRILASLLSIDYKKLLTVVKDVEEQNMKTETSYNVEKQTDEITSIYVAMLTYLESFNSTWGFDMEIFPEWEDVQQGRTEYMKEYYKMCSVIYKNATKFDENYEMISFKTSDRAISNSDGTFEYVPWTAACGNYIKGANDIIQPSTFKALWNYPDGDFVYFDGRINNISYK